MLDLLLSRHSVRRFTADPVNADQLDAILHAAMAAPSAGNEQAWQFVVLDDPAVLDKYVAINRNTPHGATVAILICGDEGAQKYPGYWVQDCSAAVQNILLAAHAQGLGAVWTTVFPPNVEGIRTLLGLPAGIIPFACVPIGTPVKAAGPNPSRYDAKRVHHNTW